MFLLVPSLRITLRDLVQHPWVCKGERMTPEEISTEMISRLVAAYTCCYGNHSVLVSGVPLMWRCRKEPVQRWHSPSCLEELTRYETWQTDRETKEQTLYDVGGWGRGRVIKHAGVYCNCLPLHRRCWGSHCHNQVNSPRNSLRIQSCGCGQKHFSTWSQFSFKWLILTFKWVNNYHSVSERLTMIDSGVHIIKCCY